MVGGAADLTGNTCIEFDGGVQQSVEHPGGRQVSGGPRARHGRGDDRVAHHGGIVPIGGTFFVFSDYMRPRSAWPR